MKLSEELRNKPSRDNRALLDRAADRIDELEAGYRKQSELTPCNVCKFNPPSSTDGKPCSMCPAR